jgi:hypothetical protein
MTFLGMTPMEIVECITTALYTALFISVPGVSLNYGKHISGADVMCNYCGIALVIVRFYLVAYTKEQAPGLRGKLWNKLSLVWLGCFFINLYHWKQISHARYLNAAFQILMSLTFANQALGDDLLLRAKNY